MSYFGVTAGTVRVGGQERFAGQPFASCSFKCWFELLQVKMQDVLPYNALLDN